MRLMIGPTASHGDVSASAFFWNPILNRGESRLLFLARFKGEAQRRFDASKSGAELSRLLGIQAFPKHLRHQSLSDRYRDTPAIRHAMIETGNRLQVEFVRVRMDHVYCDGKTVESHWELRGPNSEKSFLSPLVRAINQNLIVCGIPAGGGHSPHITVCYGGLMPLRKRLPIEPIDSSIDEVELVVGGGSPYGAIKLSGNGRLRQSPTE